MALLAAAGCDSGLHLAPVSGRVTVDGQPLTSGEITFTPEEGPPSLGSIGADGTFKLTTIDPEDGALVGKHKVTIMATQVSGGSTAPASFEQELEWSRSGVESSGKILIPGTVKWLVPEKYSRPDTSDLTAEVKDEDNVIDFDIKGQSK